MSALTLPAGWRDILRDALAQPSIGVLRAAHPSPLSARGQPPIDWRLDSMWREAL